MLGCLIRPFERGLWWKIQHGFMALQRLTQGEMRVLDKNLREEALVLDPRGEHLRTRLALAIRPDKAQLRKGKLFLFNNTKLAYCAYGELYVRLKERLAEEGINTLLEHTETVRGKTDSDLKELAARMEEMKPSGVILALADMGVAPATVVLGIELEKRGIPCVVLTAGPGAQLARAVAYYRAGNLCLIEVNVGQSSTVQEVGAALDARAKDILDALTQSQNIIDAIAKVDVALDHDEGLPELYASDYEAVQQNFERLRIGDGLPVIPPTESRLKEMLTYSPWPSGTVLNQAIGPTGRDITIRDVAIGAVMSGCMPQYLPVLVAAFQAMADHRFNLLQAVSTAHPSGTLILVSGPIAQELGINGGPGCMGPGFRANATIGRAVNLTIVNVCRVIPGVSDLAGQSTPAEFSFCFAEDPALSPWPLLHEERYDRRTTLVYVLKAESPRDIGDLISQSADGLLETIRHSCTALGCNNAYTPGSMVLVLNPDHARILSAAGWDKTALRRYLHEQVVLPRSMVDGRGLVPVRPKHLQGVDPVPVTRSPEDVEIVVAGGGGGHSSVILPWGLFSEAIVKPILLPNGQPARSIEDLRNSN